MRTRSADLTGIFTNPSDARMARILRRCSVFNELYTPPPLLKNRYIQILPYIVSESHARVSYEKQTLQLPDGGTVRIDWAHTDLPESAAVVVFLHEVTGSSKTQRRFVREALERGHRAVVFNRRGHDQRLTSPRFNILGDVADTVAMMDVVRKRYPNAFIGMVGISAGSGQLVNYLGHQGKSVAVDAAVAISPGYDLKTGFRRIDEQNPRVGRALGWLLKNYFLSPNRRMLRHLPAYEKSIQSQSIQGLIENLAPFAGYEDWEHYLAHCNPMDVHQKSAVPCLVLNALDDPLCLREGIRTEVVRDTPNYAIVVTEHGSHVMYREGFAGLKNWAHRATFEFLEACKQEAGR